MYIYYIYIESYRVVFFSWLLLINHTGQIDEILGDSRNCDCLADAEKCVSATLKMSSQLAGSLEARSPWGKRIRFTKVKGLQSIAIQPKGGHHRGIGRAI